jgi:hypothetical protein
VNRRHFLALHAAALAGPAFADTPKVQSLDDVLRWLDQLDQASRVASSSTWAMPAVFAHMAQSIEMSMDGYPQAHSPLFQSTVGAAAFAWFKFRGRMSHDLVESIPGAPALVQSGEWAPHAMRLRQSVQRFQAHTGPLQPHFAYGALDHVQYTAAHVMHIANHQDAIEVG